MDPSHMARGASQGDPLVANSPAANVPDAYSVEADLTNGTHPHVAGRARDRSSVAGLVSATVLCLALLVAGIQFGRSGLWGVDSQYPIQWPLIPARLSSSESAVHRTGNANDSTAFVGEANAPTLRKIEKQDRQIAFLRREVEDRKKLLSDVAERCSALVTDRDIAYKKAKGILDAEIEFKELEKEHLKAVASEHELRILGEALQSMQATLRETGETEALARLVDEQKTILAIEEQLALQRELHAQSRLREAQDIGKEISSMHAALGSLTSKIADAAEEISSHQELESEIEELAKMLHDLRTTYTALNNSSADVTWYDDLRDVIQRTGALTGHMRRKQEKQMMYNYHRTTATAAQVQMITENFAIALKRSATPMVPGALGELTVSLQGAVKRKYDELSSFLDKDEPPPNWDTNESFVRSSLGASKRLNDKLLEWESNHARKVSRLGELQDVLGLEETDQQVAALSQIKSNIEEVIKEAKTSPVFKDRLCYCKSRALSLISQAEPKSEASHFLVREFRRVGAAEFEGEEVMFEFIDALGDGDEGLVVKVRPVDADWQKLLGSFAMKIYTSRKGDNSTETEGTRLTCHSYFYAEKTALRNVAFKGESISDVRKRTGVNAAHYTGRITGWGDLIGSLNASDGVASGDVVFVPLVSLDVDSMYLDCEQNQLSMRSRVYIAQSLLRSVAHIHKAGYVHNDIVLANAGVAEDGCAFLLDYGNMRKTGSERDRGSPYNIPPESVPDYLEKGTIQGNFITDSWGMGVMLYMVFTGGIRPFFHSDPSFFEELLNAPRVPQMQNIESPCLLLHRLGVPAMWIGAVSLLLERNASIRPSVLQVLKAYPKLGSGPLQSLEDLGETF